MVRKRSQKLHKSRTYDYSKFSDWCFLHSKFSTLPKSYSLIIFPSSEPLTGDWDQIIRLCIEVELEKGIYQITEQISESSFMNQIKCLIEKIWQKKIFLNMNWNIAKLGLGLQSSASANSK